MCAVAPYYLCKNTCGYLKGGMYQLGYYKDLIRSHSKSMFTEGGRGYPRQHTRRYKGRGHFNGRMYTHAIFTR